jgi:hypothetical protein
MHSCVDSISINISDYTNTAECFPLSLYFFSIECIIKSVQTRQQNVPLKTFLQSTDVNFLTTTMIPKELLYFHLTINKRKSQCFYLTIHLTTLCGGNSITNHSLPEISGRELETQEFSVFSSGSQSNRGLILGSHTM